MPPATSSGEENGGYEELDRDEVFEFVFGDNAAAASSKFFDDGEGEGGGRQHRDYSNLYATTKKSLFLEAAVVLASVVLGGYLGIKSV